MQCASGIASAHSPLVALRNAFESGAQSLRQPADFAFVFLSGENLYEKSSDIIKVWREITGSLPFFGGSAESVIGSRTEIESQCAATVLLVSGMPQPKLFSLECIKTPDGPSVMGVSQELIDSIRGSLLVVACPITFSIDLLASALEYERDSPSQSIIPIIGGYCSSQNWQSPNLLFCGDRILTSGAVALSLPDGWEWRTIISQGCRPVGEPYVITKMEGQTIVSLGGKPAIEQLRDVHRRLPTNEQLMISRSLMIGRAISEYSETFSHGEFLIRSVQGIDPSNHGLVVTDRFQVGQTIRFHIRDSVAASADLDQLLSKFRDTGTKSVGGLLFSCNGRGSRMFDREHHDASRIDFYLPNLPLSGIFAAGEFGAIGDQNLVHGFTAIVNLLIRTQQTLPSSD